MADLETLLDHLDHSRERLLVAIEPLPDKALVAPGASGLWSVADVLANRAAWESELVTALNQIDRGKKPERLLGLLQNPRHFDEQTFSENKGRDLDRIFSDFQGARFKLEEWLELLTPRQLFDRQPFQQWLGGRTLAEIIAETTYQAEERFIPALEMFAAGWEAREARMRVEEQGSDGKYTAGAGENG
jgi:hypothetical protein